MKKKKLNSYILTMKNILLLDIKIREILIILKILIFNFFRILKWSYFYVLSITSIQKI